MQNFIGTLIGKIVRLGLAFRPNGGHALPGLVVETIFPEYVTTMLEQLPQGVVFITGTNGKTTTTKIVVQLLRANGKRVLTNDTGSNLVRGVASSLARQANIFGRLRADMAVLEIDEATAKRMVERLHIKPSWVLALNVSRDQLDRFGEVDTVAQYVGAAMAGATAGVVTNGDDPNLVKIAKNLKTLPVYYFGVAEKLGGYFPSDFELAAVGKTKKNASTAKKIDVQLSDFKGQSATYKIDGSDYKTTLQLSGQHNFLNGAAALALSRQLLPDTPVSDLVEELSRVSLAFGRGERYRLKNGAEVELVLVKNPASFTQALASYTAANTNLMIAINDNIADGRDVSWLWDVNFQPLASAKVAFTSGSRAADMALRLSYDGTKVQTIEPALGRTLKLLSRKSGDKVILATYTAMLQLYKTLSKSGEKIR